MSKAQLYYTPPSKEVFEEVRNASIEIVGAKDYSKDDVNKLKSLRNVGDNFMWMIARFDVPNQRDLASRIGINARADITARMIDGGQEEQFIVF